MSTFCIFAYFCSNIHVMFLFLSLYHITYYFYFIWVFCVFHIHLEGHNLQNIFHCLYFTAMDKKWSIFITVYEHTFFYLFNLDRHWHRINFCTFGLSLVIAKNIYILHLLYQIICKWNKNDVDLLWIVIFYFFSFFYSCPHKAALIAPFCLQMNTL